MQRPAQGGIPGRPHRPLVVRCGYDSSSRRVNFPSAATCRLESLRTRVEECFSLSAWSFYLTYTDDDGEQYPIRTEEDLTEAIAYFITGDDDASLRSSIGSPKISMRLDVVVEYDGPSLSDASSIRSFSSSEQSWGSELSSKHSARSGSRSSFASTSRVSFVEPTRLDVLQEPMASLSFNSRAAASPMSPLSPGQTERPLKQVEESSEGTSEAGRSEAPSSLTQSELGSRWLREQSQLASRTPRFQRPKRDDSDDESLGSDEEVGDIALVRDERGRYYYSYQSDSVSITGTTSDSTSEHRHSPTSATTISPPTTPRGDASMMSPILAPDCSACGVRLDTMRYVCATCGEGVLWKENAPRPPQPARAPVSEGSDSESSEGTAWQGQPGHRGPPSGSYNSLRTRSTSSSTSSSLHSLTTANGRTPITSNGGDDGSETFEAAPRGYELCPNCIESHGIEHAKAARRSRRTGALRHAFMEKFWSPEGWVDVDYAEDTECTICHSALFNQRYRCVSCPKFDLCRSCYQKVDEIHPAHIFLSLPDKPIPQLSVAPPTEHVEVPAPPARHPGAFCHNCLQDIVGPRFHCAVCPSWDLCIQCEGLNATGNGSHTADHIMMKIPIPLAAIEVEAVSRRARSRWYQQDSSVVARAAPSSRSSSPSQDTETVYAPGTRLSPTGSRGQSQSRSVGSTRSSISGSRTPVVRDSLDHNTRCANCNEWIMGRRYQCANCPSVPETYSLCSICELRSYRIHDPRHVFFKLDRPVQVPLANHRPFVPLLYKARVGMVPATAVLNPRDPQAYLKHVLHKETLCDIHADQIRGIWLRCAHCAGFDICSEAEAEAHHDPTHVFLVFKARVNMAAISDLCNLGGEPRPILNQQVYLA